MSEAAELGYATLLARVDFFSGLDRVTLAKARREAPARPLCPGDRGVMREGDPGDTFDLIAQGTFRVYAPGQDGAPEARPRTSVVVRASTTAKRSTPCLAGLVKA